MANRKSRSNRRTRVTRKRTMRGGAYVLSPMNLKDTSMMSASKMSNAQGMDFFSKHVAQHGGALMGAPVGETGVLEDSLRGAARLVPLDASYSAAANMRDQSGGRRRKRRNTRGTCRKSRRNTRSNRRSNRRTSRRQSGGMRPLGFMDADAPGMLLSGKQASQALSNMSSEWKLAENPGSFSPRV
jgi:hypothetical protein